MDIVSEFWQITKLWIEELSKVLSLQLIISIIIFLHKNCNLLFMLLGLIAWGNSPLCVSLSLILPSFPICFVFALRYLHKPHNRTFLDVLTEGLLPLYNSKGGLVFIPMANSVPYDCIANCGLRPKLIVYTTRF